MRCVVVVVMAGMGVASHVYAEVPPPSPAIETAPDPRVMRLVHDATVAAGLGYCESARESMRQARALSPYAPTDPTLVACLQPPAATAPAPALGSVPPRADAAREDAPTTHYGYQVLLVDLASLALVPVGGAGLLGYVAGGPLVHLAHDNARGAGISLALRLGLPALAGIAYTCLDDRRDCDGGISWDGLYGSLVGAGVAILIDTTINAEVPRRTTPAIAPTVTHDRAATFVGLGGAW